ncbi:GIY-YIG nuclease family protein [Candidatus Saccharibacteria bacterium]|nr:GIY-YIG nuclease family protein [Candidatus Saccharibacteria bacterium]
MEFTLGEYRGPMVFVDVETDGMNYTNGHVIEVAAIRVENGKITDEFKSLINPGKNIPRFITGITGIKTSDVADAPYFDRIAERLYEVMEGALFVAHNVRFDFSFLKSEFRRVGMDFSPRLFCTVRLSRALYPEQKSHKLASLIERHNLSFTDRHRAYDDAHALWQFVQIVARDFSVDDVTVAFKKQQKYQALPPSITWQDINALPDTPGVYFFEDDDGAPLYIGKSITIRRRVMSHFNQDSEQYREFKMAQQVKRIRYLETSGELEALLLESHLIKEKQPLFNRKLRRISKLVAIREQEDAHGYKTLTTGILDDPSQADEVSIIATYTNRGKAKSSLETIIKTFQLCPKLCGIEKAKGPCFSYQLGKCKGACVGEELPHSYNARLDEAFDARRVDAWPYDSPVIVQERTVDDEVSKGFVVDDWRVLGSIEQEADCEPVFIRREQPFDLDAYKILHAFIGSSKVQVSPIPRTFLESL